MEEEKIEELEARINSLEKRVEHLATTIGVMKRDHSYDMGRVFEEIDKITGKGV